MEIKTEEQTVTTIKLLDSEVRHFINHPHDLVSQLTRATGIVPSQIVLAPRKQAKRKADDVKKSVKRGRKPAGGFRCTECQREFKNEHGLHTHQAKAHGSGDIEIGTHQPGE
jgi:hypothetical protein